MLYVETWYEFAAMFITQIYVNFTRETCLVDEVCIFSWNMVNESSIVSINMMVCTNLVVNSVLFQFGGYARDTSLELKQNVSWE